MSLDAPARPNRSRGHFLVRRSLRQGARVIEQWAQQAQRLPALLGQAKAGLDCRSLQRGQRDVLERRERAGVSIVTRTGVEVPVGVEYGTSARSSRCAALF